MFENFRPKPKQETAPVVTENTAEQKESIENQIEQETVKLDVNLESLKAEIDGMGGVEGLNKLIESNKESVKGWIKTGVFGVGAIGAGFMLEALGLGLTQQDFTNSFSDFVSALPGLGLFTAGAVSVMGGIVNTVPGVHIAFKDWWENRKLKSLKNKAESAGIA